MTPDDLRAIMVYLRERVCLDASGPEAPVMISFRSPTEAEMIEADLDPAGVKRMLQAPWWDEMVTDIIETPDMCDREDSPSEILAFARDVVTEYIRKRFPLGEE